MSTEHQVPVHKRLNVGAQISEAAKYKKIQNLNIFQKQGFQLAVAQVNFTAAYDAVSNAAS